MIENSGSIRFRGSGLRSVVGGRRAQIVVVADVQVGRAGPGGKGVDGVAEQRHGIRSRIAE
jgi:hypothetical protein